MLLDIVVCPPPPRISGHQCAVESFEYEAQDSGLPVLCLCFKVLHLPRTWLEKREG